MRFKDVFDVMVLGERKIRRKGWRGYWYWQDGEIMIVNADGEEFMLRATPDLSYTMRQTLEYDWEIVDDEFAEYTGKALKKLTEALSGVLQSDEDQTEGKVLYGNFGTMNDDTRFEPLMNRFA